MIVVRNCFVCKPGNASKLAAQLKDAAAAAPGLATFPRAHRSHGRFQSCRSGVRSAEHRGVRRPYEGLRHERGVPQQDEGVHRPLCHRPPGDSPDRVVRATRAAIDGHGGHPTAGSRLMVWLREGESCSSGMSSRTRTTTSCPSSRPTNRMPPNPTRNVPIGVVRNDDPIRRQGHTKAVWEMRTYPVVRCQ